MDHYLCAHLLTDVGWHSPGWLSVDAAGFIVEAGAPPTPCPTHRRLDGAVLPAMPNLHSHAFQRALSGRTEHRATTGGSDSFWTWRAAMYDLALRLSPDELEAIASMLFVEMLEAGQTTVGEFHYLHHAPDGSRYADLAQTSVSLLAAARHTGISMTLLPVLYRTGGLEQPPAPEQRRFTVRSIDEVLTLRDAAVRAAKGDPLARVGLAPHSLRAVPSAELTRVVDDLFADDSNANVHIHVAEQPAEVDQCLAVLGRRPVQHLLDEVGLDARWCAVHATHLDEHESAALAASDAIVGLCPTTEANLGDGVFRCAEFLNAGGSFGIGSDSHVTVSASDELRTLEYGQRLSHLKRNILSTVRASPVEHHVGHRLWVEAAAGGATALGQPVGALTKGRRADFIHLDLGHPRLVSHRVGTLLDALVFGTADDAIDEVYVAGRRVVEAGRHIDAERVTLRFRETMRALYG